VQQRKKEIKILNIFYNETLRYLSGARKTTHISELYLFTGLYEISRRIEIDTVIYWNRLLHVPETNPIYDMINNKWFYQWKKYLRFQKMNKITQYKQKTYEKRTIFWKSFITADKYDIINNTNFIITDFYNQFYRLNKYTQIKLEKPSYIKLVCKPYDENEAATNNNDDIYIFTDGSLKYGFGGYGIYCEYYPVVPVDGKHIKQTRKIFELSRFVGKATDINFIELLAVPDALNYILQHKKEYLYKINNIYVIIDNKQAAYLLGGKYLATEPYFNKYLSETYKIAHKIYTQYKIITVIQWCKGHTWLGNIKADKLANKAVDENIYKNTLNITPISTATTKHLIKTILNTEKLKLKQTKQQHVISQILNKWNIFDEYEQINIDITILSKLYFCILTQLRTGHIKLNFYGHQLNHMEFYKRNVDEIFICDKKCCIDNNNGYCSYCGDKTETVHHFIMFCDKYKKQRDILYLESMKVLIMHQLDFSLKNLLFPPSNIKNRHRKHIFDSLCLYVLNTKRLFFNCS